MDEEDQKNNRGNPYDGSTLSFLLAGIFGGLALLIPAAGTPENRGGGLMYLLQIILLVLAAGMLIEGVKERNKWRERDKKLRGDD